MVRKNGKLTQTDTYWQINRQSKQPKLNSLVFKSEKLNVRLNVIKKTGRYRAIVNRTETLSDNEQYNKFMSYMGEIIEGIAKGRNKQKRNINYKIISFNDTELIAEFKEYEDFRQLLNTEPRVFPFSVSIQQLSGTLDDLNKRLNYISSFRNFPNRTFLETKLQSNKVSKFGDGYLDQILVWQSLNSPKYRELIKHLNKIKLIKSLRTFRIKGGRYDVRVKTKLKEKYSSLSDVGFGVSQFLPILVADLQLGNGSTLLALQPEIHLHPQMQSNFGDYVVNQIKSKDKRYIIETHSEYFLNKVRLHIVKGTLKPDDVSVYYLENDGVDNKAHKVVFNDEGEIINAPKSFFETYMMDLKELAINSIK